MKHKLNATTASTPNFCKISDKAKALKQELLKRNGTMQKSFMGMSTN